jgi:hypothetical protein
VSLADRVIPVAAVTDRASVVAALAGVAGVSATPAAPDVPTPGAAWPVWDQTTYAGRLGAPSQPAYLVYVLLPAGYAPETIDAGDRFISDVVAALWPLGHIEFAEPVAVRFDDAGMTMPAIRIRLVIRG